MDTLEAGIDAASTYFNVKADAYAAKGDGVTDDRAAIQAAIDAAAAASRGGIVYFPSGDYLIGTPGLVLPSGAQKAITLQGASYGSDLPSAQGTRLIASAGGYTLLAASGTGTSTATMNNALNVRDMTLHGGNFSCPLAVLDHCNDVVFSRVRFGATTSYGLHGSQLWNCYFNQCRWAGCGTGGTGGTPAVLLDATADGAINTVHFSDCEFELNAGSDLVVDGTASPSFPAAAVYVSNSKFERASGYCVHAKRTSSLTITGGSMNTTSANPCLYIDSTANLVSTDGVIYRGNNAANVYLVQIKGGDGSSIVGGTFNSSTVITAYVRLDSSAGRVHVLGCGWGSTTPEFSDARTTPVGVLQGRSQVFLEAGFRSRIITDTYGTTVTPDASAGRVHQVIVTDGVAWTLANPSNTLKGMELVVLIYNGSGGAMGVVTFGGAILQSGFTVPADTKGTMAKFICFDGTNWRQQGTWSTAV